jgi:Lrp/AsnC family leucine-responsive transcriptional regulator
MDEKDLQILAILQDDGRTSNAEIARRLGMAPSAVLERIRKLEQRGAIRGYHARLDPETLGAGLLAYVFVQVDDRQEEEATGIRLARLPQVQEVHHIAGEDCYLVKLRCASTGELGRLLQQDLGEFGSIRRTRTTIVLGTIKEELNVPVPSAPGNGKGSES